GTRMLFVPSGVASGYSLFQFLATAHGTSSTLQFDATTPPVDPGADTWYVDDVSVVAANATTVPEPPTLLVFGVGLVGVLRYSMLQVPSARKMAAKGGEIKSGVLYSRFWNESASDVCKVGSGRMYCPRGVRTACAGWLRRRPRAGESEPAAADECRKSS